jgi:SAM-dependent methyltransferase
LGPETARNQARRVAEGFVARYLSGDSVLDIGYRGGLAEAEPVTETAIGIERDYPGYDGRTLPFADGSQDAVFASHMLQRVDDYRGALAEWYRVLKIGGYLVLAVPHQQLYERKAALPSRFNGDHKRFYTPCSLLGEMDEALPLGGYRIRSLRDIDTDFSYDVAPERNPVGCYEIELGIETIRLPVYADRLKAPPVADKMIDFFVDLVTDLARAESSEAQGWTAETMRLLLSLPLPPYQRIRLLFPADVDTDAVRAVLRRLVQNAPFDEAFYLAKYADIRAAVQAGKLTNGKFHFVNDGYFHNRMSQPVFPLFD